MKKAIKKVVRFYPTVKMARRADGPKAPAAGRRPYVRLGEREVIAVEAQYPFESRIPMVDRLRAGDACYAVPQDGGGFGAFVWVASERSFYIPEVAADVWVPDDVAYFYEAFTFPEARGRGLMSSLLDAAVMDLAEHRAPNIRCEAWVARRNKASMRCFGKAGFETYDSFFFLAAGPVHLSVGRPWLREGSL